MAANLGIVDVCEAKAGDVVVVSGAAGAVGSIVGQIAKIKVSYFRRQSIPLMFECVNPLYL